MAITTNTLMHHYKEIKRAARFMLSMQAEEDKARAVYDYIKKWDSGDLPDLYEAEQNRLYGEERVLIATAHFIDDIEATGQQKGLFKSYEECDSDADYEAVFCGYLRKVAEELRAEDSVITHGLARILFTHIEAESYYHQHHGLARYTENGHSEAQVIAEVFE